MTSGSDEKNTTERKINPHLLKVSANLVIGKTGTSSRSEATRIRSLNVQEETHSTSTDHEDLRLGTIFYLGYLVFEFPQNQRLSVGKRLSFNIVAWAIALPQIISGFIGFGTLHMKADSLQAYQCPTIGLTKAYDNSGFTDHGDCDNFLVLKVLLVLYRELIIDPGSFFRILLRTRGSPLQFSG
ncbi:hypothetical protein EDD18DRAFT_1102873 [Armillaria luteobubalina]|uniref:Uncharacterized protein n=1 Tax=Armillaria luteobubalina TaxID=153913 RepID=A0AA39QD72_9AGAR|nr:hypothetical protein EDD18DRAFT_1102873 [Armillaria luteobubalina]